MRHLSTESGLSFRERKDMREAGRVGAAGFVYKRNVSPGETFWIWEPLDHPGADGIYVYASGVRWPSGLGWVGPGDEPALGPGGRVWVRVPLSAKSGTAELVIRQLEGPSNQPGAWVTYNVGSIKVTRGGFAVPTRRVGVTRRAKLRRRRQRLGRPGRRRRWRSR